MHYPRERGETQGAGRVSSEEYIHMKKPRAIIQDIYNLIMKTHVKQFKVDFF